MKCIKGTRCELWTANCDPGLVTCNRGAEYLRSLAPTRVGEAGIPLSSPPLPRQQHICKTLATPIIIIIWIRFERVLKYSCEQKISKCLHVCVHYDVVLDCVCVCVIEKERERWESEYVFVLG